MNIGTKKISIVGLVGVSALLASAALAAPAPKEKVLTLKSLPPAVQKTAALEQKKGAVIRKITEEEDNGKTVYELAMKLKGRGRDIIIGEDGTIVLAEDEMKMASLPAAVRATFENSAGKGKIIIVESVTTGGKLAYYEAQVRLGKNINEVKVGTDGLLIPAEKK